MKLQLGVELLVELLALTPRAHAVESARMSFGLPQHGVRPLL